MQGKSYIFFLGSLLTSSHFRQRWLEWHSELASSRLPGQDCGADPTAGTGWVLQRTPWAPNRVRGQLFASEQPREETMNKTIQTTYSSDVLL